MKTQQLNDFKKQDEKSLLEKVRLLKQEITDWQIDKGMNKQKDLKQINKNRRSIAQLLTIWRQKQMLKELDISDQSLEVKSDKNTDKTVSKKKGKKDTTEL